MYVDFTNLNNACPKDSFSLSRIDQLVDSIAGHELLTFMDAFSSYNQIRMNKEDQEKTTFVTSCGHNRNGVTTYFLQWPRKYIYIYIYIRPFEEGLFDLTTSDMILELRYGLGKVLGT